MHPFKLTSIVLLVLMLTFSVAGAAERMAISAATANIRSGPGTNNEQLWQVEKYYPLIVLEKKGTWCRIKDFEGDEGWVEGSLLDKTITVIVKVPKCNVRSEPSTESATLFSVTKGIPFKVLQAKGQWLQVAHADGDSGWLMKNLVW